jgi:hypothetical protein
LEGNRTAHRDYIVSGLDDWRMVFDGRHKLVLRAENEPILFDMEEGPLEEKNIAKFQAKVVERLSSFIKIA